MMAVLEACWNLFHLWSWALKQPEAEDDLTFPFNLIRNTGWSCQDCCPQMNMRLYSRSTDMALSALHLDPPINSFIQDTKVRSPEVALSPRE